MPVTVRGGEPAGSAGRTDCNICGGTATISLPGPVGESLPAQLRESLVCGACGSISRDRALILGLAGLLGERGPLSGWEARPQVRVFETSGYRGHPGFLDGRFDYFNTIYAAPPEDGVAGGGAIDGRTTADVQDMPYPDDFFGVILSSEVLEHVADERRAIAEMARTLAPGGHLVLQVPYGHTLEHNLRKVHRWHGRDVHLYPPEYHAEETLVYRIYGRELLDQLGAAGFSVAYVELDLPDFAIVPQSLILGRRGGYVDLAGFAVGPR